MSNSKTDLLHSSIADAKLIKEIAVMNAKKAIEESFAPHVKNMLSTKINEMDAEDEENDLRVVLANLGTPEEIEAYISSVEADEDQYNGWSPEDYEEDFKNYVADKTDTIDENEEEFDLDALLQEMSEEEVPENPEDPNKNLVTEDEDITIEDDEDTEDNDEDPEIDLDNLSEEDLKGFIESVIEDMVEAGELEAGEDTDTEEDTEFDIENDIEEDPETETEELAEVKTQLNEALNANKTLRTELKDLNLLNSKLLYVNRIYKSKVLTEDKKVKVLDAFEKVKTVKEAKMTYELLNENLSNAVATKPKNQMVKGFASNPMIIKENKGVETPILEDAEMFKRFKTLAGL